MKQMDMAPEESLEQLMQQGVEERKRQLRRHKLPEKATLASMLTAMTKAELDDIRFNLNVTGASSLKKAELVERLCPAITAFSERWMMSLLEEEYQLFRDLAANGGRSEALSDEDDRL
ncbi:MAG TPA: zinc chelation protein SecC, partial [Mitsuokella multacida]|nr:zinc chelation protein SecC [Mitsuokella multacida]